MKDSATKTSLLSHLQENRDDVESWLVLSDMLQEQDDIRGQLIALEYSLQQQKDEEQQQELRKMIEQLQREHKKVLVGPLAELPTASWELKWGYVWKVDVEVNELEQLRVLLTSPCCQMIESLRLKGEVIHNLTSCLELLSNLSLRMLDFSYNNIGTAGAQAIAESTILNNLSTLNLHYNGIGDEGAKAIAESTTLSSLSSLNLGHNGIREEWAQALQ